MFVFAAAVAATMASQVDWPAKGPIIGIVGVPGSQGCDTLTEPLKGDGGLSCFTTMYAKWVQQGTARTIAIPYDMADNNAAMLDGLLDSINGVLFTGGGLKIGNKVSPEPVDKYMRTLKKIYDTSGKKFHEGVHFPIWGTCMGFQSLTILGAGGNKTVLELNAFDSEDISLPLFPTDAAKESRLLGSAPHDVYHTLTTYNVTANLHHDGVVPSTYQTNPELEKSFSLLATSQDRKGKWFGAMMEHKEFPIYATQFHPERPQFEWTKGHNFNRTYGSTTCMQWMSHFFITEANKNAQRFTDTHILNWALNHSTEGMRQNVLNGDNFGCDNVFIFTDIE